MSDAARITAEERKPLAELKNRLKDVHLVKPELFEDRRMINWLRARNMKVDDAEAMFRKHLVFRKEHNIDYILTNNNIPIDNPFVIGLPVELIGHDKDGNLIMALAVQNYESKRAVQTLGREVCLEIMCFLLESAYSEIEKLSEGWDVFKKAIYICDLEGFKFNDFMSSDVMDLLTTSLKVVEANYPELLMKAVVINAPLIFSIMWNTLKPFLSARTLSKITIMGQNQEKWQPVLYEYIDPSQLPRKWGGTKYSARIPVLNVTTGQKADTEGIDLTEAEISPGDMLELCFEVEHPKAILSWVFKMKSHDIGFSLLYRPYPQERGDIGYDVLADREIVQYRRIMSTKEAQSGSLVCDMPGHYTLRFDNSYSRFREKTIFYHVEMTPFTTNANGGSNEPGALLRPLKSAVVVKSSKYIK